MTAQVSLWDAGAPRKRCTKCRKDKPLDSFGRNPQGKGGLAAACKQCHAEHEKQYRSTPEQRARLRANMARWGATEKGRSARRGYSLRRRYGIGLAEYEALLAAQGGGCAICHRTENVGGRVMAVDHCHRTGRVRGILCNHCNAAIGLLDEDPGRAGEIAAYLARNGK